MSSGRAHKIPGLKFRRTHHVFSDLEAACLTLLEFQREVLDIREQFPCSINTVQKMERLATGDQLIFSQRLKKIDVRPVREDRFVVIGPQSQAEPQVFQHDRAPGGPPHERGITRAAMAI